MSPALPTANEVRVLLLKQRHRQRQAEQLRQRLAAACDAFNETEHATTSDRLLALDHLNKLRANLAQMEGIK
jgi:hypothetical protein